MDVVTDLRGVDAPLDAGMGPAAVLHALEVRASMLNRSRAGHRREAVVDRAKKCEAAARPKHLKHENLGLEWLIADLALDIPMLRRLPSVPRRDFLQSPTRSLFAPHP